MSITSPHLRRTGGCRLSSGVPLLDRLYPRARVSSLSYQGVLHNHALPANPRSSRQHAKQHHRPSVKVCAIRPRFFFSTVRFCRRLGRKVAHIRVLIVVRSRAAGGESGSPAFLRHRYLVYLPRYSLVAFLFHARPWASRELDLSHRGFYRA